MHETEPDQNPKLADLITLDAHIESAQGLAMTPTYERHRQALKDALNLARAAAASAIRIHLVQARDARYEREGSAG